MSRGVLNHLNLPDAYKVVQIYKPPLINCLDDCYGEQAKYKISKAVTSKELINDLNKDLTQKKYLHEPIYPFFPSSGCNESDSQAERVGYSHDCFVTRDYFFAADRHSSCPTITLSIEESERILGAITNFKLECAKPSTLYYQETATRDKQVPTEGDLLNDPFRANTLNDSDTYYIIEGVTDKKQIAKYLDKQMVAKYFVKSDKVNNNEHFVEYRLSNIPNKPSRNTVCSVGVLIDVRTDLNLTTLRLDRNSDRCDSHYL